MLGQKVLYPLIKKGVFSIFISIYHPGLYLCISGAFAPKIRIFSVSTLFCETILNAKQFKFALLVLVRTSNFNAKAKGKGRAPSQVVTTFQTKNSQFFCLLLP